MQDFVKFKTLYEVTDADFERVRLLAPVLAPKIDSVVEQLYHFMRATMGSDFQVHFPDEASVHRGQSSAKRAWREFFDANWDDDYVKSRTRIGEVHAKLHIEPHHYLAVLNRALKIWSDSAYASDINNSDISKIVESLWRVGQMEGALVVDVYTQRTSEIIQQQARAIAEISIERATLEKLEKARTLAEEAAKAKTDFLANMSHEIRTPLNAIIGLTHLALKANPESNVRGQLKKIQFSGKHLLKVINDILDFSKIEAGKMPIENVDFELDEVIDNAVSIISEGLATKELEIIVDIDDDVPRQLVGDPLRIDQILINYLNNAVKFTDHGEISISVNHVSLPDNDVKIRFSVRDSGIGISDDTRQNLFKGFEQGDASTTRKHGGTGLGLAIAKKLAEAMGGDVGVESVLGSGSVFWFTACLKKSLKQNRRELSPNFKDRSVLLIDDNDHARYVEERILRSFGLRTKSVSSSQDAITELTLASAQGRRYDLVFLDWMMPGTDGIKIIEKVLTLSLGRLSIIPMIAAHDRDELLKATVSTGIIEVLPKPATASSFFNAIMRVFANDLSAEMVVAPTSGVALPVTHSLSGYRVLLVEDNELNQEVATGLLNNLGIFVDVAENGVVALKMSQAQDYDLILMDVQMPMMDGLTATRELRKKRKFNNVPILAMTASVMSEDQRNCLAAGMNALIAKPIDPDALYNTLRKWLPTRMDKKTENGENERKLHTQDNDFFSDDIEGLNVESGLRRVLGKKELYISLLGRFISTQQSAPDQICKALKYDQFDLAERLAHTLNGVSGNLGAVDVQAASAKLENIIREKRPREEIEQALTITATALASLIHRIERILGHESQECLLLRTESEWSRVAN